MTRKRFISSLAFFVLISLLVVAPVLLSSNIRYFSIIYAIIIPILLLTTKAPYLYLTRLWNFWLFIIINIIAVFIYIYIDDRSSVINLIILTLSYVSIFYLVSKGMEVCGEIVFVNLIFKYIGWILIIAFLVSPVLTLLHWPANAPEYFPWEAFYDDKRLLLVIGQHVGHSNSLWLMAFTAAFVMSNEFRKNRHWKIGIILLVLFLILGLILTKSRLALIFIGILMIAWLSYNRIIPKPLYAVIVLIIPLLYFGSIAIPSVTDRTIALVENVQSNLPSVRISASSHLQGAASVYTGRHALNIMLMGAVIERPLFGVGHSDDRMRFGVNKEGSIAYGNDMMATTESGLRMLAKYGIIYYSLLILFVITPILRAARGYYNDNIFVISVCGIILLSGIGTSIFENLYGLNGLYVVILLMFHIMRPYTGSAKANLRFRTVVKLSSKGAS